MEEKTTIVVIDAEPVVRSTVTAILRRAGYAVRATENFGEAIEWIRESQPRLVLTNVFLRGITGHDAMLKLRKEFPDLRVLMVSGLPDDETIREWLSETRFDAFPKPFTPAALVEKVREMLD